MGKCKLKIRLKGRDVLGKKTLIIGEAGSGKTKLLAELLRELIALIPPEKITVIDLAPEKADGVGGKLTDYVDLIDKVKYFSPEKVYTPRLTGTSPEEVLRYAELNREIMAPLLNRFIQHPTENLVVNDVTLYLHSGELETVLKCAKLAKTFVATAYYGIKLSDDLGTGISARERQLTDRLATFMDSTVRIS